MINGLEKEVHHLSSEKYKVIDYYIFLCVEVGVKEQSFRVFLRRLCLKVLEAFLDRLEGYTIE